jgi:hypothetical protein
MKRTREIKGRPDPSRFKTRLLAFALVAGSLLALHPQGVAAQGFEVGPGLVIEIETTTTAPGMSENLQQGLNSALAVIARYVPTENVPDWNEALEDFGPPETITQDVTVYIKGARIRVDIGANSLLGKLAPDGSVSEWAVLDPASGQVMESDFFDAAMRGSEDPYAAFGGDVQLPPRQVSRTNETRQMQGHTVQRYVIEDGVALSTGLENENGDQLGAQLRSVTDAWVATDGPYTEDPGIVQFFRVFGGELGLMPRASGQPSSGDNLPPGALVLATREVADVSLAIAGAGPGSSIAQATSSTEIKSISRQELDDDLFDGFEAEEKECKCSCQEFVELQAIGRLPKAQQQNEPRAMALAMCAPECGMAWAMNCGGG